jgi:hypothetical protein
VIASSNITPSLASADDGRIGRKVLMSRPITPQTTLDNLKKEAKR